jgi:hypothetical protein
MAQNSFGVAIHLRIRQSFSLSIVFGIQNFLRENSYIGLSTDIGVALKVSQTALFKQCFSSRAFQTAKIG